MKIYLFMCLGDVLGDVYYTDEEEVIKLVGDANAEHGGDFWYKEMIINNTSKTPRPSIVMGY